MVFGYINDFSHKCSDCSCSLIENCYNHSCFSSWYSCCYGGFRWFYKEYCKRINMAVGGITIPLWWWRRRMVMMTKMMVGIFSNNYYFYCYMD